MKYLVDSDVLIQAKNLHYAFGVCPGFWDWLDAAHADGQVFSVAKVRDELCDGRDELADRAKGRASFFLPPDDAVVASLTEVSAWATRVLPPYSSAALAEFLAAADYYLVGHAHAHGFVVVTAEVASDTRKKVKIPDACAGMRVRYVSVFDMLRAEGAKFVLG